LLGFPTARSTLWELPFFYFKLRYAPNGTDSFPTWLAWSNDPTVSITPPLYYGFPPESSFPGYLHIAPDFLTAGRANFSYPEHRRNQPDPAVLSALQAWIDRHLPFIDSQQYIVGNTTSLIALLEDNGFVLDYVPTPPGAIVAPPWQGKVVFAGAGWSTRFIPVWAEYLQHLLIQSPSRFDLYADKFAFNRILDKPPGSSEKRHSSRHLEIAVGIITALICGMVLVIWIRRCRAKSPVVEIQELAARLMDGQANESAGWCKCKTSSECSIHHGHEPCMDKDSKMRANAKDACIPGVLTRSEPVVEQPDDGDQYDI
jgi:hypothetical protein